MLHYFLSFLFVVCSFCGLAQKQYEPTRKQGEPRIDGKPDDAFWSDVSAITEFIIQSPDYGKPSPKKTTVKIAYNDVAIYVLAYMYDAPEQIRRQFTQRDVFERQDTDYFGIGFDTYFDKQNAFSFVVTAAGVQGDMRFGGDDRPDLTWDAVWMSATSMQNDGWVAELKIPLSALRFAKKDVQTWGMQLQRFIRLTNTQVTWSPEDPNIDGNVNQWGQLRNLKNITPPLRLSFLPYISGGVRNSPTSTGRKTESISSGGMDIKWGINESFTVDMTLVPDFAQVQSDNVILNLTPFQIRFDDFRPFFTEGTELFNKAGLFYSRRIGAEPQGVGKVLNYVANNPQYTIEKNPGITRLINATKLSGRTRHKTGIGIFNAVTAQMEARLRNKNTGADSVIITEPLTNYNVIVIDQALKNRSSITFTNTNALRADNSRNANVSAVDVNLFNKKNIFGMDGTFRLSQIWGTQGKYNGFTSTLGGGKVSGKVQYRLGTAVESDQYDPNDVGFLMNNNSVDFFGNVSLNYNYPKNGFNFQRYRLSIRNTYLYNPFKWQELELNARAFVLLKNFWDFRIFSMSKPLYHNDYFEARTPGVNFKRIPWVYLSAGGSSDSRKKAYISLEAGYGEDPIKNAYYYNTNVGVRYRFSPRLQINTDFKKEVDFGQWGFSHRANVSTLVPGFRDPIAAFRNVFTNNLIVAGQYSFTPRMNWTIRMRHNWTKVENRKFYSLSMDGTPTEIPFVPNRNRNFNVFNIDMFYTWDFKWGSRLTFSWKNALGSNVSLSPYTYNNYLSNVKAMFQNPHSNELQLKIVYFLDYLDIKRK